MSNADVLDRALPSDGSFLHSLTSILVLDIFPPLSNGVERAGRVEFCSTALNQTTMSERVRREGAGSRGGGGGTHAGVRRIHRCRAISQK